MSDLRLEPLTAFGARAPREEAVGAHMLIEAPRRDAWSIAAFEGRGADAAERIAGLVGRACAVGGWVVGASHDALWVGPDRWMLFGAPDASGAETARLAALFGDAATCVEQHDAWATLALTGPEADRVVERLAAIDLAALGAGAAQRASIAHIGGYVACDAPRTAYRLLTLRSYAPDLRDAALDAMRSVEALSRLA